MDGSSPLPGTAATTDGDPVVLAVDDDEDLADTYALWLENRYEVRTAYGGEQALDALDGAVDVVLLDRRMPQVSGDEVLATLEERDLDVRVSMLTAVAPDSDVVDLPFDEYLVKPVTKEELVAVVDDLLLRSRMDERTREYLALNATEETLDARDVEEFRDPSAVDRLRERVAEAGRDETVRRQVAELERLEELNGLIRSVDRALVEATAREEIEQSVVERLVEDGPYERAWIGDYVGAFDELAPRESHRADDADPARAVPADGDFAGRDAEAVALSAGAVSQALQSGSAVAVDRIAADEALRTAFLGSVDGDDTLDDSTGTDNPAPDPASSPDPGLEASAGRGGVAVPLTYRETVYGVLLVAARTGHPVTDRERTVLGELGDAIANAINAVESKQLLFADSVVELELRIADGADLFVDLTRSLGATFDLEGFVPSADGAVTCYATVSGADAAEVFAYLAAADAVRNHRGIDETGDETLLECTLEDDSVVLALLGAGANLRTLFVEEGRGHLTAEIAAGTDVRTVLEAV
ncbi:MAG: bacterio-opsin activator domain-containing protein, partial [Halobacteriales archaeon]